MNDFTHQQMQNVMSKSTIKVIAQIIARTETIIEVHAILQAIVTPTRREIGCLSYQLFRNNAHEDEFVFIEEWMDERAIEAHFATPHIQEALARITPLLATPPNIQRYRLIV